MTNKELQAIVEAAKARQDEITPAPWGLVYNHYDKAEGIVSDVSHNDVINARNGILAYSKSEDVDLIVDAPNLNAAVIALAARVEALEAARNAEYRTSTRIETEFGHYKHPDKWCWRVYKDDINSPVYAYLEIGFGFDTEIAARKAARAYIDNLTAPEIKA